jgi:hypothetical protein
LLLAVLAVGCGQHERGDCEGRIMWRGVEWDGLGPDPHVHPHGSGVLGRGAILGCNDELVESGDVVRLAGVDPRVAVGFDPDSPQAGFVVLGVPAT